MAVSEHADRFVALLTEKFKGETRNVPNQFSVMPGRKFDRIVAAYQDGTSRRVHAFVERETGAVLKAAGWNAPATGARYSTVDRAAHHADLYGAYLYDGYLKHVNEMSR